MKRDGKLMSPEHSSHASENGIDEIKKMATVVINTDNMSLDEQTEQTLKELRVKELTNA